MFSSVFTILIITFVLLRYRSIANSSKKNREKESSGSFGTTVPRPSVLRGRKHLNNLPGHLRDRRISMLNDTGFRDDPNNWLIYQLREEQRAKAVTDEMFNLKRAHEENCEAREIKEYHLKQHGKE